MVKDDGKIVNLATFRRKSRDEDKREAKEQKEKQATINRVRFGRPSADKKRDKTLVEKHVERLDAHRRDKPVPPEDEKKK